MFRFRPFINADPPHLAEIWCSQAPQRGLAQPVTASVLEQRVFSKLLFDREGLIVATRDGAPCGFVHSGFGPTDDESGLLTDLGVVCLLQVRHGREAGTETPSLAEDLLARAEEYLRGRGAKVLYGGGIRPLNPFYLGLYGGSELPGILESDTAGQAIFRRANYREVDCVIVLHRDLTCFRPTVNRRQIAMRRQMSVSSTFDPPTRSWWQASTLGDCECIRFDLLPLDGGMSLATATFWNVEPLATSWGVPTAGLIDLEVAPTWRRKGLATFLLGEAFRQLHIQGVRLVEAQTMQHNTAALAMYSRLGFTRVDRGSVMRKDRDCHSEGA